jgi:inosose dehydratase
MRVILWGPGQMGIGALRALIAVDADTLPFCLDVGHYLVGGGDPVEALSRMGSRVTHVHLKDVDGKVLGDLRTGVLQGLDRAVGARVFTELGAGTLDLLGCLRVLADRDYDGWLMVEQDSSWSPPSEAAAIGRRVLAHALQVIGAESAALPNPT